MHVRVVLILLVIGVIGCTDASAAGDAFGSWTANRTRSPNPGLERFAARFEPHPKGEVFTLDRIDGDGRVATSSTILYFDGQPRPFEDLVCLGKQSSRRLDSHTVEILRECASGVWIQLVRRLVAQNKLVLEITEQHPDGRRFERRLVMEKQ